MDSHAKNLNICPVLTAKIVEDWEVSGNGLQSLFAAAVEVCPESEASIAEEGAPLQVHTTRHNETDGRDSRVRVSLVNGDSCMSILSTQKNDCEDDEEFGGSDMSED